MKVYAKICMIAIFSETRHKTDRNEKFCKEKKREEKKREKKRKEREREREREGGERREREKVRQN